MCRVILYPGEDGCLIAGVPSLAGCISQGKTRDDALKNIREAMETYINALVKDNDPIPPEQTEVVDL